MNNVFIKDEKLLNEKIEQIKKEGKDNLHIISDFDNTLSKAYVNGEKAQSMIGQVRRLGYLGKEYQEKYDLLYNTYHPIEINSAVPFEEKYKAMEDWWSKHIKVLSDFGLSKQILDLVLKDSNHFVLRDKIREFFDILYTNDIPVLIFSAGAKYFVDGYLKKYNCVYSNISVIANEYDFDSNGKVIAYKNKIIHSLNKGELAIKEDLHYKNIKQRRNIVLLGDNLGDLEMSKGLEHNVKITICFYNDPKLEHLEEYKRQYDIVITNDSDMSYVNDLLKKILD